MPAFAGQIEAAVGIAVKFHPGAPDQHFIHAGRALAAEPAHRLAIIMAMPGHQDVFFQSSGVALALRVTRRRRGAINDAALGQFGIAVRQVVADIEQQYVATGVGKGQSRSAAGHAGTDDQDRHMAASGSHRRFLMNRRPPACGLGRGGPVRSARRPP